MTEEQKRLLNSDYASWSEYGVPWDEDEIEDYLDEYEQQLADWGIDQEEARDYLTNWMGRV